MALIGQLNLLAVVRETPSGLFLDGGEHGEILLPGTIAPKGLITGQLVEVFVYPDSQGRLIATTEKPLASVGEFAGLRVVSVNPGMGAFLDWGLPKDLLLPRREQTGPVRPGDVVPVFVYLDPVSDRIVASAKVERFLSEEPPRYRVGQSVRLLLTRRTPLGFEAIINNAHRGLLYHNEFSDSLEVGERVPGFIRTMRPDGKIDLSLDASGYQRVAPLADRIVTLLERNGGSLPYDDDTDPAVIRREFGASKKAFKQALGQLYKRRRIRFCEPGIQLLGAVGWQP
jgi:predicted RNA-binding protein (virulence factor B family)